MFPQIRSTTSSAPALQRAPSSRPGRRRSVQTEIPLPITGLPPAALTKIDCFESSWMISLYLSLSAVRSECEALCWLVQPIVDLKTGDCFVAPSVRSSQRHIAARIPISSSPPVARFPPRPPYIPAAGWHARRRKTGVRRVSSAFASGWSPGQERAPGRNRG